MEIITLFCVGCKVDVKPVKPGNLAQTLAPEGHDFGSPHWMNCNRFEVTKIAVDENDIA